MVATKAGHHVRLRAPPKIGRLRWETDLRVEERARERRKLILRGLQQPVFVVNFKGTGLGVSLKGQLLEATGNPNQRCASGWGAS